ncbi:MAG: hypothetical protein LAP40_10705 [Acidobacteriia bacterium]|nr:hypothetical protein [Terriglobia bacterium]
MQCSVWVALLAASVRHVATQTGECLPSTSSSKNGNLTLESAVSGKLTNHRAAGK